MMIETNPIKIKIDVSTETTTRDGFFTPCFIAETEDTFLRTSVVTSLEDVIDLGFSDESNCYSYCNTLFSQENNTIDQIIIRTKYPSETYLEAFLADDNSSFFYVTIESKELQDIIDISDYIETIRKMLIFSTNQDWSVELEGRKNLIYIFDDATSTPTTCSPIGLFIPETEDLTGLFEFTYNVNGEPRSYDNDEITPLNFASVFSNFITNADISPVIFVGGSGGVGHFRYVYGLSGGVTGSSLINDSQTITITSIKQDSVEILFDLFGENSISIHSCGIEDFEPL